ncbi:hypothetical protein [Pseudodesulfovibrio sediminis]|uniref:Uncharacterized protein n=1 Tax=Pseudodesulfovibrio sediminis TaxID=2810563 RepID=A0ABN6EXE7_9BACT|nr:hypothetical protein [Pseudodesulfovibrio sediminis]BCS89503.1 hypothetical protein PSDVSF_27450 [Pseudodesulfovibrio sediminis]
MAIAWKGLIRILKPVGAGLALAFLATALVDKPAPVHFQPENPYAAKQTEILEPQADLVIERNIMKLGSPFSVQPAGDVVEPVKEPVQPIKPETEVLSGSTVESDLLPDPPPQGSSSVKGAVTETPEF